MTRPRILVVGLGNTLMADDGAGIEAVRRLRGMDLSPSIRIEEAGADVLNLASIWQGEPRVWLVDALVTGASPGTVHVLDHDVVVALPQRHATVHHLSLPESLRWLCLTYPALSAVRFRLWGIEVERVAPREGLSTAVAAAVDDVVERLALDARR